jgi:hypothetical protein
LSDAATIRRWRTAYQPSIPAFAAARQNARRRAAGKFPVGPAGLDVMKNM